MANDTTAHLPVMHATHQSPGLDTLNWGLQVLRFGAFLDICQSVTTTAWSASTHKSSGPGSQIPTLAPMVRETAPSVVNISVQARVKEDNPLYRGPWKRRFRRAARSSSRRSGAAGTWKGMRREIATSRRRDANAMTGKWPVKGKSCDGKGKITDTNVK